MTRKSNMGVSMVEILIAMAIFVALLTPIVSSLITGMKTTTSAKETQYRNEYARNLMENVKGMPISVLQDEDAAENYFASLGATVDVQIIPKNAVDDFDTYVIKGTTNIGTESTQYAYAIEITGDGYQAVNNQKSGIVEDLDQTDVALISAPFSNYDYPAYDALLTKKLAAVRLAKGSDFDPAEDIKDFADDQCKREIILEVTYNENIDTEKSTYTVVCRSKYTDGLESVEYTSYAQTFDKLPNVYLMYNTCIYNGRFAESDTITYNVDIPDEELKVFVVTTPKAYSEEYKDLAGVKVTDTDSTVTLDRVDNGDVLYRTDAGSVEDYVLTFADDTSMGKKVHIYCDLNLDSEDVNPDDEEDVDAVYQDVKHDTLAAAQDGRGLYKVRIWMQPGAAIDLTTNTINPVLEGTRGGDEIE